MKKKVLFLSLTLLSLILFVTSVQSLNNEVYQTKVINEKITNERSLLLDGNVINFYYEAQDTSYFVKYLEKGTDKELEVAKVVEGKKFNEEVTEDAIDIEGYTALAPVTQTLTLDITENVITFYYDANILNYTVRYLEKGTDKELALAKVASAKYNSIIDEKAIEIFGYTALAPTETSMTITQSGTEIIFYYEVIPVGDVDVPTGVETNNFLTMMTMMVSLISLMYFGIKTKEELNK